MQFSNYFEVHNIFILLAELGRETYEERQTAMHYAAKNNATQSLKVMLRLGGRINDRDYKRRTPLFVSAETGKIRCLGSTMYSDSMYPF